MNTETMMRAFEAYYGEMYSGPFKSIMKEYLDTFSDQIRQALFMIVIRKYSRRWGKAPDVATIEEFVDAAFEEMKASRPNLIEHRKEPTDEERAEVERMFEEAKKTPAGRMLLGILGSDKNGQ